MDAMSTSNVRGLHQVLYLIKIRHGANGIGCTLDMWGSGDVRLNLLRQRPNMKVKHMTPSEIEPATCFELTRKRRRLWTVTFNWLVCKPQ